MKILIASFLMVGLSLGAMSFTQAGNSPNYRHDESKNRKGPNTCDTNNDCDGARTCSGAKFCQGTAR